MTKKIIPTLMTIAILHPRSTNGLPLHQKLRLPRPNSDILPVGYGSTGMSVQILIGVKLSAAKVRVD